MADVFISYKREDRAVAEKLATALERNTLSVWWDSDLQVGDTFRAKITQELDNATYVVVLWSARSVSPDCFVVSEASRAQGRKALLPVRIQEVNLPLGLDQTHYVDLCNWEGEETTDGFQRLLRTLSIRLRRGFTSLRSEKQALLVAVDDYVRADDFPLRISRQPCMQMLARALTGAGFKVTVVLNPTNRTLHKGFKEFTDAMAANDLALAYFAGHARLDTDEGLCLCSADTEPDELETTGLSVGRVARYLNGTAADKVIVLLDCDFSVCAGNAIGIEEALTKTLGPGKGKHLAATNVEPMKAPSKNPGAFVLALAEGLENFTADIQKDHVITLDEWFKYGQQSASRAGASEPRIWAFNVSAGAVEIARRAAVSIPDVVMSAARPEAIGEVFLDRVQSRIRLNKIIPFLGDGIYGSGPLSSFEIVGALARSMRALKSDDVIPLATIAQYCLEANGDNRKDFLSDLSQILDDQASRCKAKLTYEFILGMRRPWVAMSSTYDWFIEGQLAAAGVRFMVVAHVLHSRETLYDGRLAIVRFGSQPRFQTCLADELLPDEKQDCIIYKVLGSPFLSDFAPPEDEIDTVVITETDHMTFLGRLENQAMCVPTALSPPLKNRHLLFLGYNLDIWHYRLVSNIFSKRGPAPIGQKPFAVRQPTSAMEESFWRRLETDLVCSDTDTFATAIGTSIV